MLTVEQVAVLKDCDPETVRRAARRGRFAGAERVLVDRHAEWRIPQSSAKAWTPANTKPNKAAIAAEGE